jgi:hypothetical protein
MAEADDTPEPPALDEIYVAARRVLLDALGSTSSRNPAAT